MLLSFFFILTPPPLVLTPAGFCFCSSCPQVLTPGNIHVVDNFLSPAELVALRRMVLKLRHKGGFDAVTVQVGKWSN